MIERPNLAPSEVKKSEKATPLIQARDYSLRKWFEPRNNIP